MSLGSEDPTDARSASGVASADRVGGRPPTGHVLVIGAGPAGLAAAAAALTQGAAVTVLDGSGQLGGQYWRHGLGDQRLQHGWSTFTGLRDTVLNDPACTVLTGAQVWAIEPGPVVHTVIGPIDGVDRETRYFTPDALVLATGAHDRTLPFPGWDLPGVYTAGAAQAIAKAEGLPLGRRVLVAGAGPFLLPVAESLSISGAEVVAVLEAGPIGHLARGWLAKPWQLLGSAGKARELGGYAAHQARHRIPYRPGQAVISARGTDRVEAVTIARVDADWRPIPGTAYEVDVDAVCVSHGFTPRLELAVAAGCALTEQRFVAVDEAQQTSVPGVFAAGEITAIGGADAALAEGTLAGHVAAGGSLDDRGVRGARRTRKRMSGFAARIEAAHGIGSGWSDWVDDETLVCRCEEVTCGRLRAIAAQTPDAGLRSLKLTTRAGLGPCQGRICGRTVEDLLDCAPTSGAGSDQRPIAAPIRLGELATVPTTPVQPPAIPTTSPLQTTIVPTTPVLATEKEATS